MKKALIYGWAFLILSKIQAYYAEDLADHILSIVIGIPALVIFTTVIYLKVLEFFKK